MPDGDARRRSERSPEERHGRWKRERENVRQGQAAETGGKRWDSGLGAQHRASPAGHSQTPSTTPHSPVVPRNPLPGTLQPRVSSPRPQSLPPPPPRFPPAPPPTPTPSPLPRAATAPTWGAHALPTAGRLLRAGRRLPPGSPALRPACPPGGCRAGSGQWAAQAGGRPETGEAKEREKGRKCVTDGEGGGGKCKTRQEMRLKKCKRLEKEIRKRGREEFGP